MTAKLDNEIELDFPRIDNFEATLPHAIVGLQPIWTGKNGMVWFVEVETEEELRNFEPDFININSLGLRGLTVTSRGSEPFDFVSRFFAPQSGVPEDPVTGSAHCSLAPYWSAKLGKSEMRGFQASQRGGEVGVLVEGDRVKLRGRAVTVLEGTLRC